MLDLQIWQNSVCVWEDFCARHPGICQNMFLVKTIWIESVFWMLFTCLHCLIAEKRQICHGLNLKNCCVFPRCRSETLVSVRHICPTCIRKRFFECFPWRALRRGWIFRFCTFALVPCVIVIQNQPFLVKRDEFCCVWIYYYVYLIFWQTNHHADCMLYIVRVFVKLH